MSRFSHVGATVRPSVVAVVMLLLVPRIALSGQESAQNETSTLSVREAVQAALARNILLGAARARHRATEAQITEARSGYLPQLSFTAGYTRFQEPNIINPIHEAGVFPPLDDDIYEGAAQLRIPLFNGGRTGAEVRAAKALVVQAQVREDLTEFEILSAIGQVFIQAEQLEDQQRLLVTRLDALREQHREMSLLQREGRVTATDVALVSSTIEVSRSDSLALESQSYQLALRLGQLVGSDGPVLPATTPTEVLPPSAVLELPIRGTDPNATGPRVRMAEAELGRAEAQRSASRSMFWPEVSAIGVYTARAGQDRDPIGEWAAGIAVRIPLFDGGRKIGATRGAAAAVQAAREELRAEQQNEQTDLRIARDRWNVAQLRRELLADAVAGRSASVTTTQQLYSSGRVSLSELLSQEAELLRLRIDERREAHAARLAVLDYYAIEGTLTPELVETLVRRTQ